ncbi:MAG: hypothetical protein HN534_05325 [Euryarchaeota archaeon]|nr:hypothetical protein [Euryarchaeota archaeon]MBT3654331.1 hypothetical protein [Euryarchaeota archaeon]MBT3757459.1 hypothetical protein [Euryarchaeota archaeon]MBT4050551.1 hypothetical protein [Euryarchaeota archaeon]MBT4650684.1 hypothetical protein [Euryarchaeota archaeon]
MFGTSKSYIIWFFTVILIALSINSFTKDGPSVEAWAYLMLTPFPLFFLSKKSGKHEIKNNLEEVLRSDEGEDNIEATHASDPINEGFDTPLL